MHLHNALSNSLFFKREKLVTYRYEAETRKVTEQIIGKLSRLLELNNKYSK